MRTAEQIIMEQTEHMLFSGQSLKDIAIAAINEARKEAIEECAEKCKGASMWSEREIKIKILSLIKELK